MIGKPSTLIQKLRSVSSPPQESIRVLFVEDDPQTVRGVRQMLNTYRHASFLVDVVTSVEKGSEALQETSFDVVLLSYELSGERSAGSLQRLNQRAEAPPIIALTGLVDNIAADEAMRHGAYDYFPRDLIHYEILPHTIYQLLQKYPRGEGAKTPAP